MYKFLKMQNQDIAFEDEKGKSCSANLTCIYIEPLWEGYREIAACVPQHIYVKALLEQLPVALRLRKLYQILEEEKR